MAQFQPVPWIQLSDDAGAPLVGGKVFTYVSGTTTLKTTFTDAALTIPNTNPIVLNARGEAQMALGSGAYTLLLLRADNTIVKTIDGVVDAAAAAAAAASTGDTSIRSDLSAVTGATMVGYQPPTGLASTVDAMLRQQVLNRANYASDVIFNAAKVGKPSQDALGNFDVPVTPVGTLPQLNLSAALNDIAAGPRDAICYNGAISVRVFRNFATMGGFRFRGQYTKGRAPTFPMPASKVGYASFGGLGAGMTAPTYENWYALFAVANDGDAAAQITLMPYLRVMSNVYSPTFGYVCTLNKAGEGIHAPVASSGYNWANDVLANTDCLVISENGGYSGRVTTIRGNSSSHVALTTGDGIVSLDWLLPAPTGFKHYVYLGSFYLDTAEVRNIYDTGTLVKAKMIYITTPNIGTGAFGPGAASKTMHAGGYICPLATAIVMDSSATLSTTSAGDIAEYFDVDGASHIVDTRYNTKDTAGTNMTYVFSNIQVPFLYHQSFNYSNAGSLAATRISGQLNITGWIEP